VEHGLLQHAESEASISIVDDFHASFQSFFLRPCRYSLGNFIRSTRMQNRTGIEQNTRKSISCGFVLIINCYQIVIQFTIFLSNTISSAIFIFSPGALRGSKYFFKMRNLPPPRLAPAAFKADSIFSQTRGTPKKAVGRTSFRVYVR
jgi:hypothetical protein